MEEGEGSSPQEVGMVIRCHQYRLSLPSPTNVWIEMGVARPGIQATDVLLFVFHTDQDDEPTELVTYTQHKVGEVSLKRDYNLLGGGGRWMTFTYLCGGWKDWVAKEYIDIRWRPSQGYIHYGLA